MRFSHGHVVTAGGLRWLRVMLLPPIPRTGRVWALPFLIMLASSERSAQHHRRHQHCTTDLISPRASKLVFEAAADLR